MTMNPLAKLHSVAKSELCKRPIVACDLYKSFPTKTGTIEVLHSLSLTAEVGESVAIMGASGEGKSTLLYLLGGLDTATSGKVTICGKSLGTAADASIRNQHIGFVFQAYHLLEDFTVLENVLMPCKIGRMRGPRFEERALSLLHEVGLSEKADILAKYLSGGEKQRVAIARALITDPDCIFADEPTGNLDTDSSEKIQSLLLNASKHRNKTLIVVTHDQEFAAKCDRILLLKERRLYTLPLCEGLR